MVLDLHTLHEVLGNASAYIPLSYYDNIPEITEANILVCDFSFDYKPH